MNCGETHKGEVMATRKKTTKKAGKKATSKKKASSRKKTPVSFDRVASLRGIFSDTKSVEMLKASDSNAVHSIRQYISTQSLELDRLLNNRGIPCGRVVEIYGPAHLGKSTLLDQCIATTQRLGGEAVLFQTDVSRDNRYMAKLGVDIDRLQLPHFESTTMETVAEAIRKVCRARREGIQKGEPDYPLIIGWDAIGLTTTLEALNKSYEENNSPGKVAKLLWQLARDLMPFIGGTQMSVVVVNHEYHKINTFSRAPGGAKESFGGQGMKYASSIRMGLYGPLGLIKDTAGVVIGKKVGVRLDKNRLGDTMGSAEIAVLGGVGIDNLWTCFTNLQGHGLITTSGSWSSINLDGTIMKFQGLEGLRRKVLENEELYPRLVAAYRTLNKMDDECPTTTTNA